MSPRYRGGRGSLGPPPARNRTRDQARLRAGPEPRKLASVMAVRNPADLRELRASGRRLLGLDLGAKTIGTALSDTRHIIASPLETIRRTRFRADAALLRAVIERNAV